MQGQFTKVIKTILLQLQVTFGHRNRELMSCRIFRAINHRLKTLLAIR